MLRRNPPRRARAPGPPGAAPAPAVPGPAVPVPAPPAPAPPAPGRRGRKAPAKKAPARQAAVAKTPAESAFEWKQRMTYVHQLFRAGKLEGFKDNSKDEKKWLKLTIPVQGGEWPGIQPPWGKTNTKGDPNWPKLSVNTSGQLLNRFYEAEGKGPTGGRDVAGQGALSLARAVKKKGLKFNRLLGWGGMGVVVLFEKAGEYFVMKANFDKENKIKLEKKMQMKLVGAEHIVQIYDLDEKLGSGDEEEDEEEVEGKGKGKAKKRVAKKKGSAPAKDEPETIPLKDIILLEYCARGTLARVLSKLASRVGAIRTPIPDKILWLMFRCLVKAAVAMAFPPRDQAGYVEGTVVDEEVPAVPIVGPIPTMNTRAGVKTATPSLDRRQREFVNFDIDPLNILVGEYDDGPWHAAAPCLKMSDFGLLYNLEKLNAGVAVDDDAWNYREAGKERTYIPEQFSPEWDHLDPKLKIKSGSTQVAGQYTSKSNIWSIGQVMWSAITLRASPVGQQPWAVELDGTGGETTWSYGALLLNEAGKDARKDWAPVDRKLRETVVRCMMDDPQNRPDLGELVAMIDERFAESFAKDGDPDADSDVKLREWLDKLIGEPPEPTPQTDENVEKWLNGEAEDMPE